MTPTSALILVLIFAGCSANFPDIPNPRGHATRNTNQYRLPNNTIPHTYDITIEPIFDPHFNFTGWVTILIEVLEDTNQITLHGNAIKVNEETVVIIAQSTQLPLNLPADGRVTTDPDDLHFIHIHLDDVVEAGEMLEVYMEYTGVLNTMGTGFYRARYEEDGETKWFGTTQMEPTYARQAFPCYDEPALKANFTIHITRPADYTSISNMNLRNTDDLGGGKFRDNFEESVKMSTYLVAFVVSQLNFTAKENQAVYGEPALIADGRGDYGLQMGIDIVKVMEDFTGIEYSLDKMYQVAIPDDWFNAGAMENWGLVTYRDRYLLWKEGLSTVSEKQNVATIIAHELAHQWFGNLVSPLWWEYLWLNEGFATYFEYYATASVEPLMRLTEQYVIGPHQNAMESDSLATTRPMNFDAQTPDEIDNLFDRVAYDKSGAVIRMMEHFLTTPVFKRGLNIYLNSRAFGSAQSSDLWEGLQAAVNELRPGILPEMTVAEVMDTWSTQAGYPLVRVEKVDGKIVFSQSRFLLLDPNDSTVNLWTIPINYATASDPDFDNTTATYWLKGASENTDITIEESDWIIVNKQETGYYRVQYDDDNWNLIIDQLNSDNFTHVHILNRAQLLDDALNLARSGRLHYNITMNLVAYLSRESDYIPLYSFFRGLTFLHRHLVNSAHYENFQSFVREILQVAYEKLKSEDTGDHTAKLNRNNVLTWLCRYDHEECVAAMHEATTSLSETSPDLQSPVYCGGLVEDTDIESKWNKLYEMYSGTDAEYLEKNRIVSAFGCTRSEELLNRLLNMIVDQEDDYTINNAHKVAAFTGIIASSEIGLNTAFTYVTENFVSLKSSLSDSQINSIISGLASRLTTSEQKTKFQQFTSGLSTDIQSAHEENFQSALSTIDANILWSQRYVDDIGDWLEDYLNNAFIFSVSIPLLIVALLSHFFT